MAKIIIFTNNFPYGDGETFLETEIQILSQQFARIHIFPLYYGNKKEARQLPSNITYSIPFYSINVIKDKIKLVSNGVFNKGPIKPFIYELFQKKAILRIVHLKNWLATSCIIRGILTPYNFNRIFSEIESKTILYFYWGDKQSGIVPFLKNRINNPVIIRFHNSDLYEEIKDGYIPYRDILLQKLTYSIFISSKGLTYLNNKYPNNNFQSKLFRLGVKDSVISKCSDDGILRIVSCSYVVSIKRIDLIIKTLNELDIKIEWTHLGGGILLEEIREQSKLLKSNIRTNFIGQIDNKGVLDYYSTKPVDLFLNVSESEGIPVSIMEAISAGIPVIATDVGGTSEIVNDSFGTLIPKYFSINDLAKIIFHYNAKREEEKKKMKKNAKKFWSENFDAMKNYQMFAEFLSNI